MDFKLRLGIERIDLAQPAAVKNSRRSLEGVPLNGMFYGFESGAQRKIIGLAEIIGLRSRQAYAQQTLFFGNRRSQNGVDDKGCDGKKRQAETQNYLASHKSPWLIITNREKRWTVIRRQFKNERCQSPA